MELQFLAFLLSRKKVCLSEYVVLLLKNYAFDNLVVARVVAIAIVCGGIRGGIDDHLSKNCLRFVVVYALIPSSAMIQVHFYFKKLISSSNSSSSRGVCVCHSNIIKEELLSLTSIE